MKMSQPLLICGDEADARAEAFRRAIEHGSLAWETSCKPIPVEGLWVGSLCAHFGSCPPDGSIQLSVPGARLLRRLLVVRLADPQSYVLHIGDFTPSLAQNLLLSVLEEPPPDALIVLTAVRASQLSGPLRSRLRVHQLARDRTPMDPVAIPMAVQLLASALHGDRERLQTCLQAVRQRSYTVPRFPDTVAYAVVSAAREALTGNHTLWTAEEAAPINALWDSQGRACALKVMQAAATGASAQVWMRSVLLTLCEERDLTYGHAH